MFPFANCQRFFTFIFVFVVVVVHTFWEM